MKIDNSFWLFLMIVGLGLWAVNEYESNSLLKVDNSNKSKIIATQSLQFNRFNQVAATAYRRGIQTEVKSQERVIEYRAILKKEPTCDLLVPQSITDRLLNYTDSLRSMYTDTGNAHTTSTSAVAPRTLTYCQAVVWVDHLLAALDKANGQLKGIRDIDAERNNSKPH
ncbi:MULTISPECIES: hypothetical protein [Providencia]|uniref:hypothetical protein n=1 Tax=Providencia TaxID=586 RepID=UPI0010BEA047|nr:MULTISPECIES: hypothetical protein [Providencia]MBP6121077.1 hypothetical protein [Providencia sp.]QCJ70456.1 hypothetical protein C9446_11710 [Providencia heimbachae]